jgi:hypothetical protein
MRYITAVLAIALLGAGTWTVSKTTKATDPQTQGPQKPPQPTTGPGGTPCGPQGCP